MTGVAGRRALRRTLAGFVAAVAVLTSCSLLGNGGPSLKAEPIPTGSVAPTDPALARYYDQHVTWRECRGTMQCAKVRVPLDYARPAGKGITLSVLKVPAGDPDRAVGALLVNPGGPGVSGVDFAARSSGYFGDEVRAVFDVVGFDPRGVGESTAVDCLSDDELDAFVATDPDPESTAEARAADQEMRAFGRGCLQRSGDLVRHVSTEEAARDMDVLRGVLGQERMAYFGASYGTYLGATYADLFPTRVGRMVLDGAVDPSLGAVQTGLVQARGFEVALRAYVAGCVEQDDCYLGNTVAEGTARVAGFLESLDARPLKGDGSRQLSEGLAVYGIWAPLYSRSTWGLLDRALSAGLRGDGSLLMAIADRYLGRGPNGYVDNAWEALYAVNCLDPHDPVSLRRARTLEGRFLEASPTFGRMFAFSLSSCSAWPVKAPTTPPVLDAPGAAPILVVGTTRDPATPLAWAEALARQLESGVLLRRDGDGHTGYRSGNGCVDSTVEAYLVSGTVPTGTVDC